MTRIFFLWMFGLTVTLLASDFVQQKLLDARTAERQKQYDLAINTYKDVLFTEFISKEAWFGLFRTIAAKEIDSLQNSSAGKLGKKTMGEIYFKYHQYTPAINYLRLAYQQSPSDPSILFTLARALIAAGFKTKAEELLTRAETTQKDNISFLKTLGKFYLNQGFFNQAVRLYSTLVKKTKLTDSLLINLALSFEKVGNFKKAEETFRLAVKKTDSPFAHTALVRYYVRREQFEQALKAAEKSDDEFNVIEVYLKLKGRPAVISYFEKKIERDATQLAYYIWTAELYQLEHQPSKAAQIIEKALRRFPENEQLWEIRAKLYAKSKKYKKAANIFKKRLPATPKNKEQLARLMILQGDSSSAGPIVRRLIAIKHLSPAQVAALYEKTFPQKARQLYLKALNQNPNNAQTLSAYYHFLRKQRDSESAANLILDYVLKAPEWMMNEGESLLKFLCLNGNGDQALNLVHQFILSGTRWTQITSPSIYQMYLTTLQLTGATREYFVFLELLLDFNPENHSLYRKIARLYEQNGNFKEALYYYKRLLQEEPDNVQQRFKVALMYARLNKKQKGLELLKQAANNLIGTYYLARLYYELGYFEQALTTLSAVVGKHIARLTDFYDPYGYVLKTQILEASGKLNEAKAALFEYKKRFPNAPQAHRLLADYLFRHGAFKQAEAEYKSLFKLQPQNFFTLRRIALCMVYQNKIKEADAFLEEQIKTSDFIANSEIEYYKGYLDHLMSNYKEAFSHYQKALKANSANAHLLLLYGMLLEETGDYDQALTYYKKAIEKDSTNARYDKVGDIFRLKHQYKKALNYYALYRSFNPADLNVFYPIALCYKGLGEEDEILNLIGMLQSFPESARRSYLEARLYELLENYVMAERQYLKSVLLQSGATPALRALAQLYLKTGNFLKAEVWTRKYYESAPQSPYNMELIGLYFLEKGDLVSAEYWFRQINQLVPWYYFSRYHLAKIKILSGAPKEAEKLLSELTQSHPERPEFQRTLALALIAQKDLKKAKQVYQSLLKKFPFTLKNYTDYGRYLLLFANDTKSARTVINRALKLAHHDKEVQALSNLLKAFEKRPQQAINQLLDLQTYYNDNNRYAQGMLAHFLALSYEKKGDLKTRDEYLALALKMDPNSFWIRHSYQQRGIKLTVVAISEKPEVIAARQKQGLIDTFQKYEDRFTSLELNDRFRFSQLSTEKVEESAKTAAEFDVSIAPGHLKSKSGLKLIEAPKVIITAPKDGHHTRSSSISVEGYVTRGKLKSMDLNGRPVKKLGKNVRIKKMPDFKNYPQAIPFKIEDFPLVPGANYLTVHARFSDGYETQSTVRVGRIAKLLYAFESRPEKAKGANRWALIVAVDDYEDPAIPDRPSAGSAAQRFKQFLVSPKGLGIPESNILILSLTTGIQPTFSALMDGIRTIARYVEPQDEVIVYFNGQAVVSSPLQSVTPFDIFLLAQDAQANQIISTGLSFDVLFQTLKTIPAKAVHCFIDAQFFQQGQPLKPLATALPRDLAFGSNQGGPQINWITLANVKQNAILLKALQGRADKNRDQKITFGEIKAYLQKNVKNKNELILNHIHKQTVFVDLLPRK